VDRQQTGYLEKTRKEDNPHTPDVLKAVHAMIAAAEQDSMMLFPHGGGLKSPDRYLSDHRPTVVTKPSRLQNVCVVEALPARHSKCS
jgi:hypothetical protein